MYVYIYVYIYIYIMLYILYLLDVIHLNTLMLYSAKAARKDAKTSGSRNVCLLIAINSYT